MGVMEFPRPKRTGSRRFRIVNVVDDGVRECLAAVADTSLSGRRVVSELTVPIRRRGRPSMTRTYNLSRPHSGIAGLTPWPRVKNLLGNDS